MQQDCFQIKPHIHFKAIDNKKSRSLTTGILWHKKWIGQIRWRIKVCIWRFTIVSFQGIKIMNLKGPLLKMWTKTYRSNSTSINSWNNHLQQKRPKNMLQIKISSNILFHINFHKSKWRETCCQINLELKIHYTSISGMVIVSKRRPFSQIALNSVGLTAPIFTYKITCIRCRKASNIDIH